MVTLDQTWIRQGLVAVPWVRFGGGPDDFTVTAKISNGVAFYFLFWGPTPRLCEQGEQGGAGVRMKNPIKNITSLFFAFFLLFLW